MLKLIEQYRFYLEIDFIELFLNNLQAAWALFVEFCTNSTVHGVRYFAERRRHWSERLVVKTKNSCVFNTAIYCYIEEKEIFLRVRVDFIHTILIV